MRRILRKIAANEHEQLGDTSTLANQDVREDLIKTRVYVQFSPKARKSHA